MHRANSTSCRVQARRARETQAPTSDPRYNQPAREHRSLLQLPPVQKPASSFSRPAAPKKDTAILGNRSPSTDGLVKGRGSGTDARPASAVRTCSISAQPRRCVTQAFKTQRADEEQMQKGYISGQQQQPKTGASRKAQPRRSVKGRGAGVSMDHQRVRRHVPTTELFLSRTGTTVHIPKTFCANRNSVFRAFLASRGWLEQKPDDPSEMAPVGLAHWDSYNVGQCNAFINTWPRTATNCLDNISTYYQRVFRLGLQADFPETFLDWRQLPRETIESSPVWFVKNIFGVHGSGITLISGYDQYCEVASSLPQRTQYLEGPGGEREAISDGYLLQRAVCNSHLVENGRKYVVRVPCLVERR